jgi:hypothetical protein
MKNPYENPILQGLYEIRECMFDEAGGSSETLVKQLHARQKETIENRNSMKNAKVEPARQQRSTTRKKVQDSASTSRRISRKCS